MRGRDPNVEVLSVTAHPNFANFKILTGSRQGTTSKCSLSVICVGTSSLHSHCSEIGHLSRVAHRIIMLNGACSSAVANCTRIWTDAANFVTDKFNAFAKLLDDSGLDTSPCRELLSLLTTGVARCGMHFICMQILFNFYLMSSDATHQFLAVTLGDSGIKRMAKTIDTAISAVRETLLGRVGSSLEELHFHVSDLHGLSLWKQRAAFIGLHETAVKTLLDDLEISLQRAEEVVAASAAVAADFRVLFLWLFRCQRRYMDGTVLYK